MMTADRKIHALYSWCVIGSPATSGFALQRLSLRHRRHPQRLPVLRDGPACNHDSLFAKHFRDTAVRKWLSSILLIDELSNQGADRRARGGATAFGRHVAAEEVLELQRTVGGQHVLLSRHSRDG